MTKPAIAHSSRIVLDCPDAAVLARFYGELLGWRVDPAREQRKEHASHAMHL